MVLEIRQSSLGGVRLDGMACLRSASQSRERHKKSIHASRFLTSLAWVNKSRVCWVVLLLYASTMERV